tara:strand:- start:1803 stop:2768 length:966 start_codon:yes stop_codon:yes gene_type:complete
MNLMIIYFIFSALLSYYFLYLIIPKLRNVILDSPNSRSSHSYPKPSGGGIVFVLIGTIGTYILGNHLALIFLPLALIGLIDDLFKVNNFIRYCFQFATSIAIILYTGIFSSLPEIQVSTLFLFLFLSISSTAIINFINFMDGIDGLVASCMSIVFIVSALKIDPSIFLLVAPLIGFLFWNWHPSKVFMGDTGSTFLGATLSGILLNVDKIDDGFKILIVAAPLLLDSFACVIRRFLAGENIFSSHSLHLYQRLYQSGWSHSKITIYYLLATLFLAIIVLFNHWIIIILSILLVFSAGLFVDINYSVPFIISLSNSESKLLK